MEESRRAMFRGEAGNSAADDLTRPRALVASRLRIPGQNAKMRMWR